MLAFPITTFDFFFTPEMIYAISGGAFTYPIAINNRITRTTIATIIPMILMFCITFSSLSYAFY